MPPLDFKLIEKLTGKTYESDAENKRKHVVSLRLVQSDKDRRPKPDDARTITTVEQREAEIDKLLTNDIERDLLTKPEMRDAMREAEADF